MKLLLASSDTSVAQFLDAILSESLDAIEQKSPPDMLPTVKHFREKTGRKNGLSPEVRAEVLELVNSRIAANE